MLCLGLDLIGAQTADPNQLQLDKENLVQIEDLSESLANALIDFSRAVQQKDLKRLARFFHEAVQATPWPASLGTPNKTIKWVSLSAPHSAPSATLTEEQLEETWEAFLTLFSEIEDARFQGQRGPLLGRAGKQYWKERIQVFPGGPGSEPSEAVGPRQRPDRGATRRARELADLGFQDRENSSAPRRCRTVFTGRSPSWRLGVPSRLWLTWQ